MANKAIDKHYLLETLKDFYTTILLTFFQKKLAVATVPSDPENGDVIIYTGVTSGDFIQGHTYKYSSLPDEWTDITPTGSGGGTWGSITGTLSDQTDLQTVLDEKATAIEVTQSQYDALTPEQKADESKIYFVKDGTLEWESISWPTRPQRFMGCDIWTDGTNTYFSSTVFSGDQYKFTGTTWEPMTWSGGLTSLDGRYVWSDGVNTYYSYDTQQYKLNGTTWEPVTWSGRTDILGTEIWTDGTNTYHSVTGYQHKLNGTTWEPITWSGFNDINGHNIWTDGTNIYYRYTVQNYVMTAYKLNGTTWEPVTFNVPFQSSFSPEDVWNDGVNTYYTLMADFYILNGNTWEPILSNVSHLPGNGKNVWTDGNNIYISDMSSYKYNGYNSNKKTIYYKNADYSNGAITLNKNFASNVDHIDINISELDVSTNNYTFKYFSTVKGLEYTTESYDSSTGIFTVNLKKPAPSAGTFYIEAHKANV